MNAINIKDNQWLVTIEGVEYTVFCAENENTEQGAIKLITDQSNEDLG